MISPTSLTYRLLDGFDSIDATHWNSLAQNAPPFLQFEFLRALQDSNSIGADTGWQALVLQIFDHQTTVAYVPLFKKSHSFGEYVFDQSWANAYQAQGLAYYPKLLVAVPFTPVTASKILIDNRYQQQPILATAIDAFKSICAQQGLSSVHSLFNPQNEADYANNSGYSTRLSVQFQWHNRAYESFNDFLHQLTSRKRKDIRKERAKVSAQGIHTETKHGNALTTQDMALFYQCYRQTYLKRSGHEGYLTENFFQRLLQTQSDCIALVIAHDKDEPVAAALYLYNQTGLYGRYWGSLRDYDGLHFECCYYAGIEFAIQHNLPIFNPGTQGEHKILRGFEPIFCYSYHYLQDHRFAEAVAHFVRQESPAIQHYYAQTTAALPFKNNH